MTQMKPPPENPGRFKTLINRRKGLAFELTFRSEFSFRAHLMPLWASRGS